MPAASRPRPESESPALPAAVPIRSDPCAPLAPPATEPRGEGRVPRGVAWPLFSRVVSPCPPRACCRRSRLETEGLHSSGPECLPRWPKGRRPGQRHRAVFQSRARPEAPEWQRYIPCARLRRACCLPLRSVLSISHFALRVPDASPARLRRASGGRQHRRTGGIPYFPICEKCVILGFLFG